jgi:hypothetical protein
VAAKQGGTVVSAHLVHAAPLATAQHFSVMYLLRASNFCLSKPWQPSQLDP